MEKTCEKKKNLCQKGMPWSTKSSYLESPDSVLPGAFRNCYRQLHMKHECESSSYSFLQTCEEMWYLSENNNIFIWRELFRKKLRNSSLKSFVLKNYLCWFSSDKEIPNHHQKWRLLWAEELKTSGFVDRYIVNDSSDICKIIEIVILISSLFTKTRERLPEAVELHFMRASNLRWKHKFDAVKQLVTIRPVEFRPQTH